MEMQNPLSDTHINSSSLKNEPVPKEPELVQRNTFTVDKSPEKSSEYSFKATSTASTAKDQ